MVKLLRCWAPSAIAVAFLTAMPTPSSATLINSTVLVDTPTYWSGYIDWTTPGNSTATLDVGPNWSVSVTEINAGQGLRFLVATTRHLVEPDGPPTNSGLFLSAVFGPVAPGSSAGPSVDTEPHADGEGHYDRLTASLVGRTAGISRLNITLEHVSTPEPSTVGLFAFGLAGLISWRRRKASGH
jgi:hypothetical protein